MTRRVTFALIGVIAASGLLALTSTAWQWLGAVQAQAQSPQATVAAASGEFIDFWTHNGKETDGVPAELLRLPRLVLHQDGALNADAHQRTLNVSLGIIDPGSVVELRAVTAHYDPDWSGQPYRLIVWDQVAVAVGSAVTLSREFTGTVPYAALYDDGTVVTSTHRIATPSDYFELEIRVDGQAVSPYSPAPYAFLMDNEWTVPLFDDPVAPSDHYSLTVRYCDMFGLEQRTIDRAQANLLVEETVLPAAREVAGRIADEFGYGSG